MNPLLLEISALSVIVAIIAFVRRRSAIGGWLLYLLFQIYAGAAASAFLLFRNLTHHGHLPSTHYLLSAVPDTLALLAIAVVCIPLLKTRDWMWIVPVRTALGASAGVALISLVVGMVFFPQEALIPPIAIVQRLILVGYFCMSIRVRRVFRTHDWGASGSYEPSPRSSTSAEAAPRSARY